MKAMMNEASALSRVFRRLGSSGVTWVLAALIAQTAVNYATPRLEPKIAEEMAAETARQPDPRMLRILSFGQLPMLVDWLWLKCLIDPSTEHMKKGQHAATYYRAELLTELDPAFFNAYIGAGHLLAIVRKDIQGALALGRKGQRFAEEKLPLYPVEFQERFWSEAWWTHLFTAYVYLFELDDLPRAAAAFKSAGEIPRAPLYLQKLRERLEKPAGEYEVGLRLLNFMISGATDPKIKTRLEERRRSLFLAQYLFELEHAFREYLNAIPDYRVKPNISAGHLNTFWSRFLRDNRMSTQDPFGGKIHLSPEGHVTSTTPHEPVFGIR